MMDNVSFRAEDVKTFDRNGRENGVKPGVLFFHGERGSIADQRAEREVWDFPATPKHVADYKDLLAEFLALNSFVLVEVRAEDQDKTVTGYRVEKA